MESSRARNLQDRLHAGAPARLSEVARALPPDTAVLEYWVGKSSAAVLWISSQGSGLRRWSFTPAELDALAELPSLLADPGRKNWREAANGAAKGLFAGVPPLQSPAIHHLVIIPDDVLSRIPFEALPLDAATLLIERFDVSYLSSASLSAPASRQRRVRWPWQNHWRHSPTRQEARRRGPGLLCRKRLVK
jgi:Uncharacterized protein conserved in bacteria